MKALTLRCDCGKSRTFEGRDIKVILKAIDESGWHDFPSEDGPGISARCPDCQEQWEQDHEDCWG